jgi:1-deoxy-D-xylulose-5-phosphate synthase
MILSQNKKILSTINSPAELKKLTADEKVQLACEIREELISVISNNGGHLAPNMGVVELTIALHSAFNAPEDKLIFDVGHQGYVHKMLTGRQEFFKTLRQDDGCLGFLSRDESEYDVFGAGHAGTAISAALGLAAARDANGGTEKILAIVGDGSLNCGISLEGLNNVAEVTKSMIIILNDNKMSISPNVGAMARYLNRLISARGYNRFKAVVRKMVRAIPLVGDEITHKIARLEEAAKSMFVPGVIFEEMGIRYIGPVNGHDIEEMIRTFDVIKDFRQAVVVHVLTEKGRGYEHAEAAPEKFHGLSSFDPDTGQSISKSEIPTFSQGFGDAVCALAEKDDDVVAITAAMRSGTGLTTFSEKYPERFFDVGIAEEHAVVFAAGLAVGGKKPIVAFYASFMQRALDYVMHDVCLQNLPVIFCNDRAGIVDDGPTHHGIHDLAFLKNLPNLSILSPKDECELRNMLFAATRYSAPVVIRYPRGAGSGEEFKEIDIPWGKAEILKEGKDIAIWAVGKECAITMEVAEILKKKKIDATVVNTRFIKPFDKNLLLKHAEIMHIATIEDCQIEGGIGSIVDSLLINEKHKNISHFGWTDEIIPHGTVCEIRKKFNFTPEAIADKIAAVL